jgi:hypothetical protein
MDVIALLESTSKDAAAPPSPPSSDSKGLESRNEPNMALSDAEKSMLVKLQQLITSRLAAAST